jgi:hypothetical protein
MTIGGWDACPADVLVPYTLVVYETVDGFGGAAGAGAAAPAAEVPSSTPQPGMNINDANTASARMEHTSIVPPLGVDDAGDKELLKRQCCRLDGFDFVDVYAASVPARAAAS